MAISDWLFGRNKGNMTDRGWTEKLSGYDKKVAQPNTATHEDFKDTPDQGTLSSWEAEDQGRQLNDPEKGSGGSSSKSSGGSKSSKSSSKSSSSSDYEKQLEKQRKEEEKRKEQLKGQYNDRYGYLSEQIRGRQGIATQERDRALSGVNAELQNLLTQGATGKEDLTDYYDTQEESLTSAKEKMDEDLRRTFQARNITESSYYLDKQNEQNDNFLKTLSGLNKEEARRIKEADSEMQYYQTQAINKQGEIESAYAQTLEQISSDLTKTDWEREDAIQALDQEFQQKMNTIDERLIQYSMEQEAFRKEVAGYAGVDTSYLNENVSQDWEAKTGMDIQSLMKSAKDPSYIEQALRNSMGGDKKTDPDVYARLRSMQSNPDTFDKNYGYLLSDDEKRNLGIATQARYEKPETGGNDAEEAVTF